MTKSNSILPLGEMVVPNQASSELANRSSCNYVSSTRNSSIYLKVCSYVTSVRNSQIYKKGSHVVTATGNTKGGKLFLAILNVEEAGVYSESRTQAFQVFLAQSSKSSYLYIFIYGLMVPIPALFALLLFSIPLQRPSSKVDENGMYFVVCLLGCTLVGYAMAYNLKAFFPELKVGFVSKMIIGLTFGSSCTASIYVFGLVIGFPVPFAITYPVVPALMATLAMTHLLVQEQISEVENFSQRFRDYMKFVAVVVSSIVLFPALSVLAVQSMNPIIIALMAISFPILKLVLRYVVYGTVQRSSAHLDIASKMCIFTVDFFGSLYLSMMMQTGTNYLIVGFIIAFDVVLNCLYGWNLYSAVKKLPHGIWNTSCSDPRKHELRSKVLHMAEFVMLTEFVECMVPLIFLLWMWISILGPNRPFWAGLTEENISFEQSIQVTYNLLLLCLLEFGSLIMLMIALQIKCEMPIFKHLSFILQEDWKVMAGPMAILFLAAVFGQLEHFGYDYTFQFKWLDQATVVP